MQAFPPAVPEFLVVGTTGEVEPAAVEKRALGVGARQPHQHGRRVGHHAEVGARQCRFGPSSPLLGHGGAQGDLCGCRRREDTEHLHVAIAPVALHRVHHAQSPQHHATGSADREAGPGDDTHFFDGRIGAGSLVPAGVADDEGLPRADHVLAERSVGRYLPSRRKLCVGSDAALQKRSAVVDQGDEGQRRLQQLRRQAGQVVEGLLGGGVEELGGLHGQQASPIEDLRWQLRRHRAIVRAGRSLGGVGHRVERWG